MKTVSILHYNTETNSFSPNIVVSDDNNEEGPTPVEISPSEDWLIDYKGWNTLGGVGHPNFDTLTQLEDFNTKGMELSNRLQKELRCLQDTVRVESYQPILQNISLNGKDCGWWHLKDMSYHYPVNLQHIPISDSLKGDFRAWLTKVEQWGWLQQEAVRNQLNKEAAVLEKRLQRELHVQQNKDDNEEPSTLPIAIEITSK